MPYCKYCGSAIDADSVFCSSCGKRLKKTADHRLLGSKSFEETGTVTSEERLVLIKDLMCELTDADLKELRTRIASYNLAISLYDSLLQTTGCLLDETESLSVKTALAKRYGLPENSIYRI
ncbi:MAG: zinc ribbon domain-containing protein [Bacteroidaceae bacterium]|nr:zinc ribbon domain-containing protein [Bacteroidaceae bacterium]